MIVYISGPITGIEDLNKAAFSEAEKMLTKLGHDVVNPHTIPHPARSWAPLSWEEYMRDDIKELMNCEMVYALSGWETSKGARLEVHIAIELGMRIMFQDKKEEGPNFRD